MFNRPRVNSIGDISELNKRKREGLKTEPIDIFQKSKLVKRSPIKKENKEKENMDEMKTWIAQMVQEFKEEMRANQTAIRKEIKESNKIMKEELQKNNETLEKMKQELLTKEEEWKKEKEELTNRIVSLEKRIEWQDKKQRNNNIVIKGINDEQIDNKRIEKFLKDTLEVETHVKSIQLINTKYGKKIVIAEIKEPNDKIDIMNNKNKLKGQKIYIDHDYTKEERKIQAIIRNKAMEEKNNGKQVKIYSNKLIVNGIVYKWDGNKEKLEIDRNKTYEHAAAAILPKN